MNDGSAYAATRYHSFFAGVEYAAIGFGGIELAGALLQSSPALALAAATSGALGLLFALARMVLQRRQLIAAIMIAGAAGSLAALAYMIALPELIASFTLFPLCVIGLAMLHTSRRLLVGATIAAVITTLLIVGLSFLPRWLPPVPSTMLSALQFATPAVVVILLALLLGYTWNNLHTTLRASQVANHELETLRDSLESQVVQRTAELEAALGQVQAQAQHQAQLLEEIERQQATIRDLGVPVLPVSVSAAVVPLIGALDSERLTMLRDRALRAVEQLRVHTLLLDLTGVEILDERIAAGVIELAAAVRLLGARVVLIGIRPEVAESIVALGVDLRGIRSIRDLRTALAELG